MLPFLHENLATILVGLALLAILALILRKWVLDKKASHGACSCGCNCGACSRGACSPRSASGCPGDPPTPIEKPRNPQN